MAWERGFSPGYRDGSVFIAALFGSKIELLAADGADEDGPACAVRVATARRGSGLTEPKVGWPSFAVAWPGTADSAAPIA